ncbi:hypothetical protein D9M71_188880 [compost metagenome]
MHKAKEVLLVELFQVAVVVLQQQVLAQLVVAAAVVERVAELAGARIVGTADGHPFFAGRVTALHVLDLAADQGQILDFVGSDLPTFEGLRQQAPIVIGDDRELGHQRAVAQFGLGEPGLGRQPQAAELVHRLVAVAWEDRTTVVGALGVAVFASGRVQLDAQQADGIDAKAHGPLGEAGSEIELKALAPFCLIALGRGFLAGGGAVAVVCIDIEITKLERGLAVFDQACGRGLLGKNTDGYSEGQGGLLHGVFLVEVFLVFLGAGKRACDG